MADEARISVSLQINSGEIQYRSLPNAFNADVTVGGGGPTPGSVTVQLTHTIIDLSQLTTPGLCRIQNLDSTNYIEVGVYYPSLGLFIPLLELLPGESYVVRLSRYLGENQDPGTGTGTFNTASIQLAAKATVAASRLLVEAFDK